MPMSDLLPRPCAYLEGFPPYRTQQIAADVRVNANEWPEPNPIGQYLGTGELERLLLNRYPKASAAADLRSALAERYRVDGDQLLFGNGSNEVLLLVFMTFGAAGRRTLLFQPTYPTYARLAQTVGGVSADELIGLPYELTVERALEAASRVKPEMVTFASPNNPTGGIVDERVMLGVAERLPESLVLVDEAYSDFSGTSIVPHIATHPNIVVAKTLSKVYAAAGLRLGILIADKRVADILRAVQLPFNISELTMLVGARVARRDDDRDQRIKQCATERARVTAALARQRGVEVFPSVANFLLFRLTDMSPAEAHAKFVEHGVLLRNMSSQPGCEGCLRVSIGTPSENDRVIAAIDTVFSSAPARA